MEDLLSELLYYFLYTYFRSIMTIEHLNDIKDRLSVLRRFL